MAEFKILTDLVSFNTIKDKENNKIMDYLESHLLELGFKTESKTKNLVMSYGEDQSFGFLGHTDTVEYLKEFENPFEVTQKGEFLYGLGVCDMKSGIAAVLDAISLIDLKNLKHGIKLYFTHDEEIGFGGIHELVNNNESFPEFMVFGEPTDNEMLTGSKGLLEYEINFKGKAAHSSNPEKGISANLNAVSFLHELKEFYDAKIKQDREELYEIPYTTMNVGIIKGGSAINAIPAECEVCIDFRVINKEHTKLLKNKVEELAAKYMADAKNLNLIEPFLDKFDFLEEVKTAGFITEASFVEKSKRIILGTGPVTAHEVNEHISIESYRKLVTQYTDLIYRVCNQ